MTKYNDKYEEAYRFFKLHLQEPGEEIEYLYELCGAAGDIIDSMSKGTTPVDEHFISSAVRTCHLQWKERDDRSESRGFKQKNTLEKAMIVMKSIYNPIMKNSYPYYSDERAIIFKTLIKTLNYITETGKPLSKECLEDLHGMFDDDIF